MSEATKSTALAHAIALVGKEADPEEVIQIAAKFAVFIENTEVPKTTKAPATASKSVATAPKPTKPAKLAAPEPADDDAQEAEAEAEAEEAGITKESVGESIQALIDADMIEEATALLTKYKAKSLGKLDPKFYGKVKAEADALLLNS